jgi:hypothetical protein
MVMSFFPALYVAFMYGIYVPNRGKANLSMVCNFGSNVDTKVFTLNHMLDVYDPEGYYSYNIHIRIISTLDSIFNTYMGMEFMRIF